MPLFAFIYMIALPKFFSHEMTIVLMQVLTVSTKGLYAAIMMDVHMDVLDATVKALLDEKRANENRRAFLKYLFHEVRSPLNSISIGIDILQGSSTVLDESSRESLVMMRGASEFMAATLNDVLSMQKMEEGKLELEFQVFQLSDCITKVFTTFRGAAVGKNLTLSSSIAPEVPAKVRGDRFRIEHVLGNLISNAIKFSPHDTTIFVALSSTMESRRKTHRESFMDVNTDDEVALVTVAVTDQGPGISPEDQKKLFSNFVQINASKLQQGGGSGLGLSLCKQIVELHGGTIGVTSEVGQGAAFHFTIPFEVVHDDLSHSAQQTNKGQPESQLTSLIPVVSPTLHSNSFHDVPKLPDQLRALVVDGEKAEIFVNIA
jgi:signal transduction histidine kinase